MKAAPQQPEWFSSFRQPCALDMTTAICLLSSSAQLAPDLRFHAGPDHGVQGSPPRQPSPAAAAAAAANRQVLPLKEEEGRGRLPPSARNLKLGTQPLHSLALRPHRESPPPEGSNQSRVWLRAHCRRSP